ncbi:AsnC family transcriptional regulator [Geothermobacter ehrlichii]|uniref:AsnC family transcriptional regulator n=1 Tax=Geothermobacter ehrlichii TaxID=213224 RepID=A0A5D3WLN3_9BACT|nr:Lrp/AsnC family transcriptional regulator [Geothermobacter ehrlichii]TYO98917.1 AsnC family transcriptional regulator [Geothermobacter ehrlichii]
MDIKRTIDDIDFQILNILQKKARIPNAEVARQVGMAPSAVLERIRKLEERGIIEGYEVRLNPEPFGQGLAAFVQVEIDPATANGDLETRLAELPGVQELHQVAGGDGYLLKIRAANARQLGQVLRDRLLTIPGVRSSRTQIVLNTVKETRRIDLG